MLEDLRRRLHAYRPVEGTGTPGWDRGTEHGYLAELLRSWADDYDWRVHEQRIRSLPWARTSRLRAVHQRAADPGATAVVLLHGWPDSVLRYQRVLPLLTDVHVVVPALPGYPFAAPLPQLDLSSADMAEVVAEAMAELGHQRYVVSAGDIGRGVATALAIGHPDRVAALHITDVPLFAAFTGDPATQTEEERALQERALRWRATEGGYLVEQATKPHTLAVALGDSPAGLAAWLVEKYRAWSDNRGSVEEVFTREEMLAELTVYWVTQTIGSSMRLYHENFHATGAWGTIDVPTGYVMTPADFFRTPRSWVERTGRVDRWTELPRGGHFPEHEVPDLLAADLRAFFAPLR